MRAWLEDEGSLCSTIGRTEEVKAKPLPLAKCATFYPVSGHFLGFGSASALLPLHLSARAASPRPGHGRAHGSSAASAAGKLSRLAAATGPADAPARPGHGRAEGDAAPPHGLPRSRRRAQRRGSSGTSPAAARRPHLTKGEKTLFVLPFLPPVDPNERRSSAQMFFFRHLIRSLRMK